jgi:hypothetical protein
MSDRLDPDYGPSFSDFVGGVRTLAARAAKALDNARPAIQQFAGGLDRRIAPFRDWAGEYGPQIVAVGAALTKLSAESHIENWETLDEDQWVRALSLMCADDGVPLAWTPPAHVVEALVDADDHAARDAVLRAHEAEIEMDARRLLDAVTHPDLAGLRAATEQGWDAWAAGLEVPSQAAAGVIIGDVLLRYGFEKFGRFREKWEAFRDVPVEEWELTELRTTAVMCALSTAVQREDQGTFPGFNRNDSLHKVDPIQYTRANALRALMLVTAAVRELQFNKAQEWLTGPRFRVPRSNGKTPEQMAADGDALRRRVDALSEPPKSTVVDDEPTAILDADPPADHEPEHDQSADPDQEDSDPGRA